MGASKRMSPRLRKSVMASIRSKDTRPEIATRSALHRLGHRFRANVKGLPGTPDIANRSKRYAIFVHGCLWHLHKNCTLTRPPKRNTAYWGPKLRRNVERDAINGKKLKALGYRVLIIWECETSEPRTLARRLDSFVSKRRSKRHTLVPASADRDSNPAQTSPPAARRPSA